MNGQWRPMSELPRRGDIVLVSGDGWINCVIYDVDTECWGRWSDANGWMLAPAFCAERVSA